MTNLFKLIWAAIAFVIVLAAGVISKAPILVLASSIVGIVFVIGAAFQWKHSNLFGAVLAGFFAYFSYEAGYFGNSFINATVIIPASLYGWWLWVSLKDNSPNISRQLTRSQRKLFGLVSISLFAAAMVFSYSTGSNLPHLDALTTVLPVLATALLVGAYKEQWYLWIVFNSVQVYMWFITASTAPEMLALLAMKVIFLINSIIGFYEWNKK